MQMKKLYTFIVAALCACAANAETITAHYYGAEIDLTQKNNPCKGSTDGGVEVIVVTDVQSVANNEQRTVITRTYKLPNGEVLKTDTETVDSPKAVVLHNLFPREYPKIKK